jgi:hypothetical protein
MIADTSAVVRTLDVRTMHPVGKIDPQPAQKISNSTCLKRRRKTELRDQAGMRDTTVS